MPTRGPAGDVVILGALVEAADQLTGGGQHDRVEALAAVGLPGVENGIERGGGVADVDALPVEIEADCFGSAVPEGEVAAASAGSAEAVEFGQPDCAVAGFDVSQDPAGPDRGELLEPVKSFV
jgi:hypothetical protein